MDPQSILTTVAEVAIALTGFTGVVAVLGHRQNHDWTPEERLQLRTLVETSLTALFASFVPSVLQIFLSSEPAIWMGANLFLGSLHAANLSAFLLRAKGAKPTTGQRALLSIGFAAILAHFLAFFGVLPWYIGIFMLGLLQQIFIATYNFVLLLFPIGSAEK